MVSRTIGAFSLFIVLNLPLKVNVKAKVHKYFKKEDKPYEMACPLYTYIIIRILKNYN